MDESYDLIIIGGGSAGLTAAALGLQFGARVALVEKHRLGGDCTWTGCVPSKTLLKAARVAHEMRNADRYGLTPIEPVVDLKSVLAHVREVIADVYEHESPERLRTDGIDVFLGSPRFLDAYTLVLDEATLTTDNVLLATGAHPFVPPIAGLGSLSYLTYESIWNLEALPQHLLVVGGGPVGCEIAQAFRRLGAEVTMAISRDRLLPRDEPEASRVLAEVFTNEGIDLRFNARVEEVRQEGEAIHLLAGGEELVGDALLVAAGRRPNVEGLDLERAGVAYSERGIEVDDNLRTSQRHIYAAGDCIGSYQFTHYAGWQAAMAVRNALLPGASKGVSDLVPWTTFTDPEVARSGLSEAQAREKFGDGVDIFEWPMEHVDRARAEGDTAGFMKLICAKDRTLVGTTIVAARAGEMIHECVVVMDQSLKVEALANVIHVYPTYSTAIMQAAAIIRVQQLLSGTSGRVIRALTRLIR
jgi:pyruvate/2-oxoglutarate dehydrogenase complex dihydrolipoamide dehydrogenase (E3) component